MKLEDAWLELERLARVEVSSEDPYHPVEEALRAAGGSGWRAGAPGPQTLSLRFDEAEHDRTQEFTLRWSGAAGTAGEIVRQQWNFSPDGSTSEAENYAVELAGVSVLELCIVPDASGGDARASIAQLRLA